MSSRQQVLSLYRSLIRESKKFSSYNYRNYALRRVRDGFRQNKHLTNEKEIAEQLTQGQKDLQVIKRQVIIGDLYKTDKLVIESVSGKT